MFRRRLVAGLSLALVTAVTACGSSASSGGGGGGNGGSRSASAPGITADTITFGMVTPLSGPQSALGLDGRAGAEAFIASVNAKGGINGRKLALQVQDDQYQPQQSVAAAKYFRSNPVFAIWGNTGTATTLAALPIYEAAQLPVLFPEAFTTKLDAWKWSFRVSDSFGPSYKTLSDSLANHYTSGAKFGFLYQNDGTSVESLTGFKQGKTHVYSEQPFERTATSYTTQLQSLRSAGVTDVQFIGNPAQIAVVLKEADQMGFHPQWWGSTGVTSPDTVKLAGALAEGINTISFIASPDDPGQGAAAFRSAMSQYASGSNPSGFALNSWVGGLLIVDALKRAGTNPTRASFISAMESTKNLDTGGLTPPVTITSSKRVANPCIQILTERGGKFSAKGDFVCPS